MTTPGTFADRASPTGVLGRLQVLRFAPTPLRGAPAATWIRPARTGTEQLWVAGRALQPRLLYSTTTQTVCFKIVVAFRVLTRRPPR